MALYRSRHHKMIAGVCGGLADWLGWSPTLVRVAYVLVSVLSACTGEDGSSTPTPEPSSEPTT